MKPFAILLFTLLLSITGKSQVVGFTLNVERGPTIDTSFCRVKGVIMGADKWSPYKDIQVVIKSDANKYTGVVDSLGRFDFDFISGGTYGITILNKNKKYIVNKKLIIDIGGSTWEIELEAVLKE